MATFTAHSALGVGVMAAAAHATGCPKIAMDVVAVYGFVFGGAPDTFDWVAAQFGMFPRWELYSIYHAHTLPHWGFTGPKWLIWQPPAFLHVFLDTWFHDPAKPGWNWWPVRGWAEITMWWASAMLIWYTYN